MNLHFPSEIQIEISSHLTSSQYAVFLSTSVNCIQEIFDNKIILDYYLRKSRFYKYCKILAGSSAYDQRLLSIKLLISKGFHLSTICYFLDDRLWRMTRTKEKRFIPSLINACCKNPINYLHFVKTIIPEQLIKKLIPKINVLIEQNDVKRALEIAEELDQKITVNPSKFVSMFRHKSHLQNLGLLLNSTYINISLCEYTTILLDEIRNNNYYLMKKHNILRKWINMNTWIRTSHYIIYIWYGQYHNICTPEYDLCVQKYRHICKLLIVKLLDMLKVTIVLRYSTALIIIDPGVFDNYIIKNGISGAEIIKSFVFIININRSDISNYDIIREYLQKTNVLTKEEKIELKKTLTTYEKALRTK